MCEIFFIQSFDQEQLDEELFSAVMDHAVDAANRNSDGWGAFDDRGRCINVDKEFSDKDAEKLYQVFKDANYVVLHLRLRTSGPINVKNTHPFAEEQRGSLLVHNGSVQAPKTVKGRADSFELLKTIEDATYNGASDIDRLETALNEVTGTLSCFYQAGDSGNLFYFRRFSDFTFARDPENDHLVGMTHESRMDTLVEQKSHSTIPRFQLKEPDSNSIYRVTDENKLEEVGTWTTSFQNSRGGSYHGGYTVHDSRKRKSQYYVDREEENDLDDRWDNGVFDNEEDEEIWPDHVNPDTVEIHGERRR